MPKRSSSYRDSLLAGLADPHEAVLYLESAIEESRERFLEALGDVVEAHHVAAVAKKAGVASESIYRMLSQSGNPTLSSLWSILETVGLQIGVAHRESRCKNPVGGLHSTHGTIGSWAGPTSIGAQYSLLCSRQSLGLDAPCQAGNSTESLAGPQPPLTVNAPSNEYFDGLIAQKSGQVIEMHA
jgi:probable addiction module antidote protein